MCVEGATCEDECSGESVAGCGGDRRVICLAGDGCNVWVVAATCRFGCENAQCNACVPDCAGMECGDDPVCGTLCGTCGDGYECQDGTCELVQTNCDEDPSQGLSQPCCLKYGVDACGAGLFCEAFDGRTVPTCYAEHARTTLQECREDLHCLSSSCNLETKKCRGIINEKCTPDTGCAPFDSYVLVCDALTDTTEGKCEMAGSEVGDLCLVDSGCETGHCHNRRCVEAGVGQSCQSYTDCSSRYCVENKCTSGEIGAPCGGDDSCRWNLYCGKESSETIGKCVDGKVGDPCDTWESRCNTDSYSGYCYDAGDGGHCYAGVPGDPCGTKCNEKDMVVCEDTLCVQKLATGRKCTADGDCYNYKSENDSEYDYDQICDPTKKICLRTMGSHCTSSSQCAPGECSTGYHYCHY